MRATEIRRPERVLMTADTAGGVWTYAMELAAGLSRAGVGVSIATMGPGLTRPQIKDARAIAGLELYEGGFTLEWQEDPWLNVTLAGDWLLRLEAYIRPDIVHLNNYCHGALPWKAPSLIVAHSCVLSWWEAGKEGPIPGEWERYAHEVAAGLKGARAVAAPTRAMLDALRRHYDFDAPGFVIKNGRTGALFNPGKKEEMVFTAGRLWDEAKNVAALQAIAKKLSWPVCAAGPTEFASERFPADGSIELSGALSIAELSERLSKAAVFALPAKYEPFGLTVLEAAPSGCALVLGDIPSLRELWEGAALFVRPVDREGLFSTIERLAVDRPLRERLGNAARERGLAYSAERMAEGYLELYGMLMGNSIEEVRACAS